MSRLLHRIPVWPPVLMATVAVWAVLEWARGAWSVDVVGGSFPLTFPSRVTAGVWHLAVLVLAALLGLRAWARRVHAGPIVVRRVAVESGEVDGSSGVASTSPTALTAIIQDVLHRVGVAPHGVIPTYSGLDSSASDVGAVAHPPVSGLLARAVVTLWRESTQPQGWTLTVEERRVASNRVAMAFLLEHRATGRLAHTDTVYGEDLAEAARLVAYQVAAWRFRRTTDRSTRANPSWYHSAKGLRMYDEALYFARGRRFDEAIDSATRGLAEDPSNLSLRRLLGETYERLEYHLDAVAVYASGLVLVRDDRNSWLRRAPAPTARRRGRMHPRPTGPREWPQTRHRRSRSREVSGVLWRYLQVLSAGDQWIDRWTDDLVYAEHLVRDRELAVVGAAPAARPLPSTNDPGKDWLDPGQFPLRHTERQHDLDRRHRQAGMIRGFLAHRYHDLLSVEFPLLDACWFARREDRRHSFAPATANAPAGPDPNQPDQAPGPFLTGPTPPGGPLSDLIGAAAVRVPLAGPRRPGRGSGPLTDWQRMDWALVNLARTFGILNRLAEQIEPEANVPDAEDHQASVRIVRSILERARAQLGLDGNHRAFLLVASALTDDSQWQLLRLDRFLVGQVASWAANRLLRLNGPTPDRLRVTDHDATVLARTAAALDMRLFTHRATLVEVSRLRRRRGAEAAPLGPGPLLHLNWLMARFRYLSRLHHIQASAVRPHHIEAHRTHTTGADHGRWTHRRQTVAQVKRVASRRAAGLWTLRTSVARLDGSALGQWNLWYYAARALGAVLQDPDSHESNEIDVQIEGARQPAQSADGTPARLPTGWEERNDEFCWDAIHALAQVILVHRPGEVNALDAGALDWILHEDPDLDRLRLHPRMRNWLASTFSLYLPPLADAPGYQAMQRRGIREQERRRTPSAGDGRTRLGSGVYGRERRGSREDKLFWLANDHYLAQGLNNLAPQIAARLRTAAVQARTDANALVTSEGFRSLTGANRYAWELIALYRQFAGRSQLRLGTARVLTSLAGIPGPLAPFPRHDTVLVDAAYLSYEDLDAKLKPLLSEAHRRAHVAEQATSRTLDTPQQQNGLADDLRACAADWEQLLDAVHDVQVHGPRDGIDT